MSLYQGLSKLGHEEIGNKLFDMLTSEGTINLGEIDNNKVNNKRHQVRLPKKEKRYKTVQIFGGLWIDSDTEFTKFVSAVNMSPFEENGEGIAYTDNHFYAYYRNIEGEPIPYYDIYLNAEQSQDVVKQVKDELKNGSKNEGNQLYIDRAIKLVGDINSEDNDYNGNNNSISNTRRNDKLGGNILRKGRYADNPSLYVKTSRTDQLDSDNSHLSYSLNLPNNDELINSVHTRKGDW